MENSFEVQGSTQIPMSNVSKMLKMSINIVQQNKKVCSSQKTQEISCPYFPELNFI